MAALVGSKELARIQGDDAQGHITEARFSLPEGDDNVAADARHTIDALGLKAVVKARSGGQCMVLASARAQGWPELMSSGRSCKTMAGSS